MNKEDFNKVWKGSTRKGILNQYYYDYIELRKVYSIIKEARETLEININEHNYEGASCSALEILDKVEENNGTRNN